MDWETEELCDEEAFVAEEIEIDLDYEFDAPTFYDFTRVETDSETEEAESWFNIAGNYPPSPFVGMWSWKPNNADVEVGNRQKCRVKAGENSDPNRVDSKLQNNIVGLKSSNAESTFPVKTTPWKNLHYMKPTASQLAKQHQSPEIYCNSLVKRFEKLSLKGGKMSSPKSSPTEIQAAKRQKLEVGYLRKLASMKHQNLLLHKAPKKGGLLPNNSIMSRLKVTIPREPSLVTAHRAERHRSKIKSEFDHKKSSEFMFRARPLNPKILKAPVPFPRRRILQTPEFQLFHLRTSERASHHAFADEIDMPNASSVSQNELTNLRRLPSRAAMREIVPLDTSDPRCLAKDGQQFSN